MQVQPDVERGSASGAPLHAPLAEHGRIRVFFATCAYRLRQAEASRVSTDRRRLCSRAPFF